MLSTELRRNDVYSIRYSPTDPFRSYVLLDRDEFGNWDCACGAKLNPDYIDERFGSNEKNVDTQVWREGQQIFPAVHA